MDFDQLQQAQEVDLAEMDEIFNQFGQQQDVSQISKSDALMFIIDCNKQIFKKFPDESKSDIQKVFQGYSSICKSKIISSPNDKIGLILYNVKNTRNNLKFNGINVVHSFDSASADRIKESQKLKIEFQQKYGFSNKKVPLYEVLWLFNNQLKTIDKKKYYLRLFLFTSQDNPYQIGDNERNQAINHAKQLASQNVQIQLFPLRKSVSSIFDVQKFYMQIITLDLQEINQSIFDSSQKIMDLQQRLRQKEFKKRTLNRLFMKIGQQTEVGIKIFSTFNKAKKPIAKKLDAKSNKPLKKVGKILSKNGDILHEVDVGTFYPIGGQKIPLKKEDIKKLKSIQPPGITLIGFKPSKRIKIFYNIRTSYFLYPDQQRVTGSNQFVDALIETMNAKDLVAIVKICARAGSKVRFAALFPQQQYFDQNHFQTPPGLNLVFLPFSDDIVKHAGTKTQVNPTQISNQLVHITKLYINSLTFADFDFRNFQNPSLQKFYANLQAHALGQQQVEQIKDLLQPNQQQMLKFDDITLMIKDTLNLQLQQKIETTKDLKFQEENSTNDRSQEEKYQKKSRKRTKKQQVHKQQLQEVKQQTEIDLKIKFGDISLLKLPELKQFLKSKGLQQTGRKQELINRILIYLSK